MVFGFPRELPYAVETLEPLPSLQFVGHGIVRRERLGLEDGPLHAPVQLGIIGVELAVGHGRKAKAVLDPEASSDREAHQTAQFRL